MGAAARGWGLAALKASCGRTLDEIFTGPCWVVTADFRDVRVAGLDPLYADAPLFTRMTAGVPLGGGVMAVLDGFLRGSAVHPDVAPLLGAGPGFGWRFGYEYNTARGRPAACRFRLRISLILPGLFMACSWCLPGRF
jgi:hypothetical protein